MFTTMFANSKEGGIKINNLRLWNIFVAQTSQETAFLEYTSMCPIWLLQFGLIERMRDQKLVLDFIILPV